MTKQPHTDIVRRLCSKGTFVTFGTRSGTVRRFDRRTNECLVQWGASGLIDSLAGRGGLSDDWLRHESMATDHHFTTLRLAPEEVVTELEGRRPDGRRSAGDPS